MTAHHLGQAILLAMFITSATILVRDMVPTARRLGRRIAVIWSAFAATFRQPTPILPESTKTPTTNKGAVS